MEKEEDTKFFHLKLTEEYKETCKRNEARFFKNNYYQTQKLTEDPFEKELLTIIRRFCSSFKLLSNDEASVNSIKELAAQ